MDDFFPIPQTSSRQTHNKHLANCSHPFYSIKKELPFFPIPIILFLDSWLFSKHKPTNAFFPLSVGSFLWVRFIYNSISSRTLMSQRQFFDETCPVSLSDNKDSLAFFHCNSFVTLNIFFSSFPFTTDCGIGLPDLHEIIDAHHSFILNSYLPLFH